MIADILLGIGAFLLLFSCWSIYRGNANAKVTIALILAGVSLIIFSDSSIKNFRCDKEGCGFERAGLSDVNSVIKADIQSLTKQNDLQNKEIERKFEKVNAAITKVTEETNTPKIALPSVAITTNSQPPQDKGVVSVFFRNGQESNAKKLVDALLSHGYKASNTNSNLKEIEKWAPSTDTGNILVAVQGDNKSLGDSLEKIASTTVNGAKIEQGLGWTFQASAAQIYLF